MIRRGSAGVLVSLVMVAVNIVSVAAFLALLAVVPDVPASGATVASSTVRPVPACRYDDGSLPAGAWRCVWDARHMGNGYGDSFVAFRQESGDPRIWYVSHRRAHRLMVGGVR